MGLWRGGCQLDTCTVRIRDLLQSNNLTKFPEIWFLIWNVILRITGSLLLMGKSDLINVHRLYILIVGRTELMVRFYSRPPTGSLDHYHSLDVHCDVTPQYTCVADVCGEISQEISNWQVDAFFFSFFFLQLFIWLPSFLDETCCAPEGFVIWAVLDVGVTS